MLKVTALITAVIMLTSGCSIKPKEYVLFNKQDNQKIKDRVVDIGAIRGIEEDDGYETKLVPNNRLSIIVFNHPELSTRDVRAQVRPADERGILIAKDGTINIPLIGVVRVSGLTERETSDLLSKEYSRYIKHAHVTVEILNKRVYVLGEVRRPGKMNIIEDTTNVLEAIANSGGLTDFAARNKIDIIRGTRDKPVVKQIDLTQLSSLEGGSITLHPNDVIYVEPNKLRQRNMAIAEALPGITIVNQVLNALFTGKQLTNTRIFNINAQ